MGLPSDVAVIGAGVAGLTAAALLARAGARVTVYEQHNVPGGCASFFQRDGFRFDVGATVANGFGPRGIHRRIFDHLGTSVAAERLDRAMTYHAPGLTLQRFGDQRWVAERSRAFGAWEELWQRQEAIADRAWAFAATLPALPADLGSALRLARSLRPRFAPLVALQGRTFASVLPQGIPLALRRFIDAQLLITAQTTAGEADLVFACTALDIAREGVYHLAGGIADIAVALARALRRDGGRIRFRTRVTELEHDGSRVRALRTDDGAVHAPDAVIAAIPYENVLQLLGEAPAAGARLRQRWGAFTVYAGLAPGALAGDVALHHQVVLDEHRPLGEGNSVFVSLSAADDTARARNGGRAVTLSTHTAVEPWERAQRDGTLPSLRAEYAARLLRALDVALQPASAPVLIETGTPLTFEHYTAREHGLVGGVPQRPASANLRARSHRTRWRNLLCCGDTIFPGQSTVGVSLSAIACARSLGVTAAL